MMLLLLACWPEMPVVLVAAHSAAAAPQPLWLAVVPCAPCLPAALGGGLDSLF